MKSSSDLVSDISCKVVSLSYDDPRFKLDLAMSVVQEFSSMGKQVQYLDFDLQFSSMLKNLSVMAGDKFSGVEVFPQLDKDISSIFLLFETSKEGGVIVIDTINTFQNLLMMGELRDSAVANHRAAIVISLLEEVAEFFSKTLLIMNLTRARPRKINDVVQWERDIVGGRMTRFKSDLILYAHTSKANGILSVEVVSPREETNAAYEIRIGRPQI